MASVVQQSVELLRVNAGAQIFASSAIGTLMLLPLQPWFPWKPSAKAFKEVGAAHLDWFMLAFMQVTAAAIIEKHLPAAQAHHSEIKLISQALCFGGWINPTAYVFRGLGIDAFVLGTSPMQFFANILNGASAVGILASWAMLFKLYVDGK